jgi:hypothetical protein
MLRMSQIASKPPSNPEKRQRVDWDAVERDYRATQMTLRELETKHGISNSRIAQKAKAHGWSRDLLPAIKRATDAKLIEAAVSSELRKQSTQATQDLSNTVLIAAEVNTQVILSHRTRLAALHADVETAKHKLMQLGDEVADIREAAAFVQAVGNLASATKTLIEQERKAFGLDEDPAKQAAQAKANSTSSMTDAERAVRLVAMLKQATA